MIIQRVTAVQRQQLSSVAAHQSRKKVPLTFLERGMQGKVTAPVRPAGLSRCEWLILAELPSRELRFRDSGCCGGGTGTCDKPVVAAPMRLLRQ